MMAPGYETGFGYLRNVAVDQYLLKRGREKDLLAVIARLPHLLGIGIDESAAVVVRQDRATVIGESRVAVYDAAYRTEPGFYFLNPGDEFDLKARRLVPNLK